MTSSLHCEFDEVNTNFLISSSVAGLKVCKVGGGEIGLVKGSGSVVGENLILMRSILSLKKSRNAFAREVVSGLFGSASVIVAKACHVTDVRSQRQIRVNNDSKISNLLRWLDPHTRNE